MTEHDENFHSDRLDQEGEQDLSLFSVEDAQLMDELREHYSSLQAQSTHTLAHAWERIQQDQQEAKTRSFQKGRIRTWAATPHKNERELYMQEKKPGRLKRMVNGLAAAVLLIAIIASMALVYSHLHTQTGTASGDPQTTATVTSSPTAEESPTTTAGSGPFSWPIGQCTYWANVRYHQLTGFWVSWTGNADQWVTGARGAGWNVSQTPHVPSIVVLMPYVQGAVGYGKVAVVESIVNNTTVQVSIMNWQGAGGGWDIVSYTNLTVGSGVYFIWHK